jgi:maleylacetate reductase
VTDDSPARYAYDLRQSRVVFAPDALHEIAKELDTLGVSRAFVLSTRGRLASLPPLDELLPGKLAGVFEASVEHVPVETVAAARADFDRAHADVCVSIGGGSAIGLGKILARDTGVPLVAVPTTYSGSEMTSIWGITDEKGKRTGRDPRAAPRVVIYDPRLTLGLSREVSAASGMNALAHAVEAMYASNASPMALAIAEESVRLLTDALPSVVANPHELEARIRALSGAHLAGRALDLAAMGLHHRLCHVLGGTFGLPHARTHAALLPYVLAFNAPAVPGAMLRLARAMGGGDAVSSVAALGRTLGVAVSLADSGLRAEDVERAAEEAVAGTYGNARPASVQDVQTILMAALRPSHRAAMEWPS